MADNTFYGYTITSADISNREENRKYKGKYFYEICLTLKSIGGNMGNSERRDIWERVFNNLAAKDLSSREEEARKSSHSSEYLLPWNRIKCRYDDKLLPVLHVYNTEPRKIEENRDFLKDLVTIANTLAQKEINKVNQEEKQLGEEREKLKKLKWN